MAKMFWHTNLKSEVFFKRFLKIPFKNSQDLHNLTISESIKLI